MRKLGRDLRAVPFALIWVVMAVVGSGARAVAGQPTEVSFSTADGGEIHALLYSSGEHAVVLAHGGVFNKESWTPLAPRLAEAGMQVLAIDFRGYGLSKPGSHGKNLYLDIIAAVSYLKEHGATRVSVLGASMGGGAAERAATFAAPGEIDRLILLAPAAIPKPEEIQANRILYITSEGDPSVDRTRQQYENAPEPKSLKILPGDAHAQHIFKTEQAEALIDLILAALTD